MRKSKTPLPPLAEVLCIHTKLNRMVLGSSAREAVRNIEIRKNILSAIAFKATSGEVTAAASVGVSLYDISTSSFNLTDYNPDRIKVGSAMGAYTILHFLGTVRLKGASEYSSLENTLCGGSCLEGQQRIYNVGQSAVLAVSKYTPQKLQGISFSDSESEIVGSAMVASAVDEALDTAEIGYDYDSILSMRMGAALGAYTVFETIKL